MSWQHELDVLGTMRALADRMGGEGGVERQHSQGKLTVRERIDRFVDEGSFAEIRSALGDATWDEDGTLISFRPGNTVAGSARVDGRTVYVRGDDFTIRGGSSDAAGSGKRVIEGAAAEHRVPLVLLLDGAGGSVREVAGRANVTGNGDPYGGVHAAGLAAEPLVALREHGVAGRVSVPATFEPPAPGGSDRDLASQLARGNLLAQVPVAAAALGSCAGWIAIAVVDTHFSVMTRETSELFVGGPPLVRQALGIDIPKQELGNYHIHVEQTGVVQNVAEDEEDAFRQLRRFLSYLPPNVWEAPPRATPTDDPNRREEALLTAIPRDRRRSYDVRRIIEAVVDRDSTFEIAPLFGRSLVTMFARVDGFPVAVIASDCRYDGGAQTAAANQKFERFVDLADTFHLPVVYLCDVPGFMIGPQSEAEGNLRWALRANKAVEEATVPYCTVIMRRFYGVAVGGSKRGPGFNPRYGWPSAESGSLPAAGGVMAAYRRVIEASADPERTRIEMEERLNALASVLHRPQFVDEIVDPRDTRPLIVDFVRRAQAIIATQLGPKLRAGMRP